MTLTEDLSWHKHIKNTVTKGNRTVGFLRRNHRVCTPHVKASTYKILVRLILEYASPVWTLTNKPTPKPRAAPTTCGETFLQQLLKTNPRMRHKEARPRMGASRSKKKIQQAQHNLVNTPAAANIHLNPSDSRTRGTIKFY